MTYRSKTLLTTVDIQLKNLAAMNHPITKALTNLLISFCSEPELMTVYESDDQVLDLTFEPAQCDLKVAIGKKGKTIMAIRHVADRMGAAYKRKVRVEVRDSFRGSLDRPDQPFRINPDFGLGKISELLWPILKIIYTDPPTVSSEPHDEKLYVYIDLPQSELMLVKALGVAFYPFGYRNGRKLSFRINNYHPNEHNEPIESDSVPLPPGMARRMA